MKLLNEPVEIVRLSRPDIKLHFFSGLGGAAAWALGGYDGHHRGVLIATNAEKLVKLYNEPRLFVDCISPIYYADGVGATMLGSGKGRRIPGVELWLHVLDNAARRGFKVSIFGAAPEVARRTWEILRERYGALNLSVRDGYQHESIYIADLTQRRPEVIFVALGSPRQELLIARLQKHHPNALYMGLGGSLDILTNRRKRAPAVFRKLKIEFAYRLLKEPTRLFRQTALLAFLWLHVRQKFGARVSKY